MQSRTILVSFGGILALTNGFQLYQHAFLTKEYPANPVVSGFVPISRLQLMNMANMLEYFMIFH
jgi:hypothetical protein